ncbi:MAG TPA: HD domain-containing protein [Caldilineaceae bacterium]|nr:HD domain-containing protein [Caldilineaceae bacterium]
MPAAQVLYRLRQFWRGLQATVTPEELTKAAGVLPPAAFALFKRLPVDGQRHSLNVLNSLEGEGAVPPPLAVAALLHDVGKVAASEAGLEIHLWWRGPLVLLETFAPALLTRLSSPEPQHGWRYLFYVHQEHPQIGARWAVEAGCSELSCWLIAHHQDPFARHFTAEHAELLARLQRADSVN